jgi:hypothetical protein
VFLFLIRKNWNATNSYGEGIEEKARVDCALDWHISMLHPLVQGVIDFMCVYSQGTIDFVKICYLLVSTGFVVLDDESNASFWTNEFDRYLFGSDDMVCCFFCFGFADFLECTLKNNSVLLDVYRITYWYS